jgi:hypothetical protein
VLGDVDVLPRTGADVEHVVIQGGRVDAGSVEQNPADAAGRHGQSQYRFHRFPTTLVANTSGCLADVRP